MTKIFLKFYKSIVLWALILSPMNVLSQHHLSEKEIIRSGKYFWGRAVSVDSILAKQEARDELMLQISNNIDLPDELNEKSEIFINYISYFVKPVEELSRAIAYVPIENVTKVINNNAPLLITPMKYSEAQTSSKERVDDNNSSSEIDIQKITTSGGNQNIISKSPEIINKKEEYNGATNTLLDRLIDCDNGSELGRILIEEESLNNLIYNVNSAAFRSKNISENFYIVIIDPSNNEIISFFDKGSSNRKDYKNNNDNKSLSIESDYKNMIQIWIQLF